MKQSFSVHTLNHYISLSMSQRTNLPYFGAHTYLSYGFIFLAFFISILLLLILRALFFPLPNLDALINQLLVFCAY